jgi:hypothetical protein
MFLSKNIVQTSMREDLFGSNNALMCEKCVLALGS